MQGNASRRYRAGPEADGRGTSFRVWAPDRRKVEIELVGSITFELAKQGDGYFSATHAAKPGDRYFVRLDEADEKFADPASRYQPLGLGRSQ